MANLDRFLHTVDRSDGLIFPKVGDFLGPYKLTGELGSGGCGVTFAGNHQKVPDLDLALKIVFRNPAFLVQESRALELRFPCMPHLYATCLKNPFPYIVMERLRGMNLQSYVEKYGPVNELEAVKIIMHTAYALHTMYKESRLAHLDINPSSLFYSSSKKVTVLDYGHSTINGFRDPNNRFGGTPACGAPELHVGDPDGTIFQDVYSLGPTLYYLVTKKLLFKTPASQMRKLYEEKLEGITTPLEGVSESVGKFIARVTNPHRFLRYAEYRELLWDLKAIVKELTTNKNDSRVSD